MRKSCVLRIVLCTSSIPRNKCLTYPLCFYIINLMKSFIIVLAVLVAVILSVAIFLIFLKAYQGHNRFFLYLRYKFFKNKNNRKKYDTYYSAKPRYLSPCEEDYFIKIKSLIRRNYFIFPQIPLSQIIEKHSQSNYKTELFRVIDFCIFDENYFPLLCIEINDTSHINKSRVKRDLKVSEILKSAKIPLLVLWTYDGTDDNYIKKSLKPFGVL